MKPREVLSRLNRAQRSFPFKVIASIVVVVLAIVAFSSYALSVAAPTDGPAVVEPLPGEAELSAEDRSALESARRMYQDLVSRRADVTSVGVGAALAAAVALVIVWLGLALTYLGLFGLAALLVLPMWLIARTAFAERFLMGDTSLARTLDAVTRLILGSAVLAAAFTALLQGLRILFAGAHPVLAIARNAIAEAVRMKISLVFIVLLIFVMAALPDTLSHDTPLRYRVQTFLQYGTGGSYWIIAILVLFFAAASVAFEQRDRQIWQTMTKPVAHWQYLLGKWLGVSGLAAVLLTVSCAGVFLFTEYLRQQPAQGETVQAIAAGTQDLTEDRLVLETQILAARRSAEPVLPMSKDDPGFAEAVRAYVEENRKRDPAFATDDAMLSRVVEDSWNAVVLNYMSIEPGAYEIYRFTGLAEAKRRNTPVILRYRCDSGANAPDQLYKLTFIFGGMMYPPQDITLGPTHSLQLLPSEIGDDGTVELVVYNGALVPDENGNPRIIPNAGTISFPTGGLELSYTAGSFRMNFVRVALVLWIKLAFLAMLAIATSTFLSFPVACLVAFTIFLIAEGAGFLSQALEYYDAVNPGQQIVYWKIPVRALGLAVTWMFKTYAELRPTTRLVDGRLMAWSSVAWGTFILACWSLVLFAGSTLIFRRRELATYSGQ